MDKRTTTDDLPDLPQSDAALVGGDYGMPVSMKALRRGWVDIKPNDDPTRDGTEDTYIDGDREGGVVGRPHGWAR